MPEYLGAADGVLAQMADGTLVLDDGELPVHFVARLCYGALEEIVSLARHNHPPGTTQLKTALPGCCKDDTTQLLRLLYSMRPEEAVEKMSLEQLKSAGSVADRFGFADTFGVVEFGVLTTFCGPRWHKLSFDTGEHSFETAFMLLCWAEGVRSAKIATMCGAYIGRQTLGQPKASKDYKAMAFYAAMRACRGEAIAVPS